MLWEAIDQRRDKLRTEREREGFGPIVAVKPRDVARYGWAGIDDCEEARRVLDVLATKGWLAEATMPARAHGPNHVMYYVHPDPAKEGAP